MDADYNQKLTIYGIIASIIVGLLYYIYSHFIAVPPTKIILNDKTSPASSYIIVHLDGQVAKRGVYRIKAGARACDLIKMGGGILSCADVSQINLAEVLKDGGKLEVPKFQFVPQVDGGSGEQIGQRSKQKSKEKTIKNKINLNTAMLEDLDKLPGVGEATAQKIIKARPFRNIDDLLKIPRFGKNRVNKIKDKVCL